MSDLISRQEVSDIIKTRLYQTALNNTECITSYDNVCEDIAENRIDTWINEAKSVELETPEDNIRRADVLELAKRGVLVGNNNYKSVCNAIEALPTADGTDQTAEWERCDDFGVWTHNYKCTHCGKPITCAESDRPNFCGNCGRRMRRKA